MRNTAFKTGNTYRFMIPVEEEKTEKVSPFILYPETRYQRTKRKDCSTDEIRRMLVNGTLSEVHDLIIKMLGRYGYLNSYMIRLYLYHQTGGRHDYDRARMRQILKMMVSMGLLVQYEFQRILNGEIHGGPFFYTISGGGMRYLKNQGILKVHPVINKSFLTHEVLEVLALNQFHITFMKQYGRTGLIKFDEFYGVCYQKTGIPYVCTLKLPEGGDLHLFICSVRNRADWAKPYLTMLRMIREYTLDSKMDCFAVIVICETEYQAMECARRQNCEENLREIDVFYLTDTSVVTEDDVFGRLIDVLPQKDYSYRNTFRLELYKGGQ